MSETRPPNFHLRPLGAPGDLGWIVREHGLLYRSDEYGWNIRVEAAAARAVVEWAELPDTERGGWVFEREESDGTKTIVGSVMGMSVSPTKPDDDATAAAKDEDEVEVENEDEVEDDNKDVAFLRLMIVHRSARGRGLGRRLLAECVAWARAKGFRSLRLPTNSMLTTAAKMYTAAGFRVIEERTGTLFGPEVKFQLYEMNL